MDEKVYEAKVTLAHLAQALNDSRLLWVYAKRLEDIVLAARAGWLGSGIPLERWEYGCAFGPDLELSWWQRDDGYNVRAITAETPPENVAWTALDMAGWQADDPVPWLLVGEYDADRKSNVPTWSTARIPRYLAYPVPDLDAPPERVVLVAQTFRQAGHVAICRLVRVEGG